MHAHDTDYCEFGEISAVVATWNAGASTPASLRHEEKNTNFFREVIRIDDPPDIIVFGFQELVDLEDKKLTASPYKSPRFTIHLANCDQRVYSRVIRKKTRRSRNT